MMHFIPKAGKCAAKTMQIFIVFAAHFIFVVNIPDECTTAQKIIGGF